MLFGAIWLCTQGENWYGVVLGGGQSSCCLELSGCVHRVRTGTG